MNKTLFFLVSLCALAFVSCQKEEMAENSVTGTEYTYVFTGTNNPEVKAAVGDKDAAGWPILWEAGDQLGVFKADGTFAGTADLTAADAGKNVGEFTLNTNVELTDGETLYLTYPYVEGTTFADGKFTAAVKTAQTAAGKSVGANAVAYATAVKAEKTSFTLAHTNAYVRLVMSTEEFKDYTLVGATLWCDGEVLSGNAAVAVADGAVTATETEDYVKSTLSEGVVMGTEAKEVWMTALPADLTGKTVYAIVHMTKGIETVTLPVALTGKQLKKHAVNTIQLPALAKSLAPAWYEPVETRYIAVKGDGWSYGPENTVLFPEKNVVKKVDLKARGNFMKVKEPAYVQIQYSADQSSTQKAGYVKYDGTTDSYSGDSHIEHKVGEDYTVSVAIAKAYSADVNGQISAMLVKDADKNVIWGINLWACFNEIKTVKYQNGDVMTYNIGVSTDPITYNNWKSNGCYFQWGRPFAFAWDANITNVNKELVGATQTFEYTMTKPYTFFYYSGEPYNWFWGDGNSKDRSGDLDDLWGNPDGESKTGVKSIYDPCPKGYRIVSPAVLAEVENDLVSKVVTATSPNYVLHEGVAWGFVGAYLGSLSGGNLAKAGSNNTTYMCAYWSNSNNGANGRMMSYQPSAATPLSKGRARAAALPVRCMVDTENR